MSRCLPSCVTDLHMVWEMMLESMTHCIFWSSNDSFIEWRSLYIKTMRNYSYIMICNFFDNHAGLALSEYNLQGKCVNCSTDLEFYCQTLEMLLHNKKVLCISPFAKTMSNQSNYLDNVHNKRYGFNAGSLPFYRCKQSISFSPRVLAE